MMRRLILIHGRAQERKDAAALKAEWVAAWRRGLEAAGLELPLADTAIRFPYFGQTLFDLVGGAERAADVVVKGTGAGAAEREFLQDVVSEILTEHDITAEQLEQVDEERSDFVEKGVQDLRLVRRGLRAIDRFIPGASGATIALVTRDVHLYLNNVRIRAAIDEGVRQAFVAGEEAVVVAHSLGSVVAYHLLRQEAAARGWRVPLLVTVGSPLGLRAIRRALAPLRHPGADAVGGWFNALDERDVVALHALTPRLFPVEPAIENHRQVRNTTPNRHGIGGYLDDPVVARRIHAALTASAAPELPLPG
jgi:hypothetical protein